MFIYVLKGYAIKLLFLDFEVFRLKSSYKYKLSQKDERKHVNEKEKKRQKGRVKFTRLNLISYTILSLFRKCYI